MSKFVIFPVATGVKFELRAGNGETVAASEVYTSRALCLRGVEACRKSAAAGKLHDLTETDEKEPTNPKFQLYQDKRGEFRFRLKARNGQTVIFSEPYSTRSACLSGMESVIRNAPTAEVEYE